jgi:hypothetical protein
MSMQTKILNHITLSAAAAGLEVTDQPQWANSGTLLLQRGFVTVARVDYDFQGTYFRLIVGDLPDTEYDLSPMNFAPAGRRPSNPWPAWSEKVPTWTLAEDYTAGAKIEAALTAIRSALAPVSEPTPREVPQTVVALLAEYAAWTDERTQISEADCHAGGVSSSTWQASDDGAFDLLARFASAVAAEFPTAAPDVDTASSVSRQHFIDTGRYLTHAEVADL